MRIHLLFPVLPPALDGIGDHTAHLAEALAAQGCAVKVLTAQAAWDDLAGVAVERVLPEAPALLPRALSNAVALDPPGWLFVQYNPFSYGRWGFNPFLPLALRTLKKRCPAVRVALMVHEPFVPIENWRFAVMTTWQRAQLWALGRQADAVFFSIAPWARRFRSWFPDTPLRHLPVGSNIPRLSTSQEAARRALGIAPDALVVGLFGGARKARLLHFVRAAADALKSEEGLCLLYAGTGGARLQSKLGHLPLINAGPLPAADVSRCFAAMDVYLAPFRKGVSTRRGSFMVGLQHGVATVSTRGMQTDGMLLDHNGSAFLLAEDGDAEAFTRHVCSLARDHARRARVAEAGRTFFENRFVWERIANDLLAYLGETSPVPGRPLQPANL